MAKEWLRELPACDVPHVRFELQRGPFGGNGATPWTALLGLGSPTQRLRYMLDTGTTNTWITAKACTTDACRQHGRFDPGQSSTFRSSGEPPKSVSFGPWGSMEVELGADVMTLPAVIAGARTALTTQERLWIYLATHYAGSQFAELDCDGGLAIPAVESERPTALLQQLYREGHVAAPVVSFYFDPVRGVGECLMGAADPARYDPATLNPLPLKPVSGELDYLWNVPLASLDCGGAGVARDSALVLDTGSSRFKGGKSVIQRFLNAVTDKGRLPTSVGDPSQLDDYPDIELALGAQVYRLAPRQYFLPVGSRWEVGIHHLEGLPDEMLLVGSVFLDTVYSVFVASAHNGAGQGVVLGQPVRPALSASGLWHNEFGSTLEIGRVSGDGSFTGRYRSHTGASGVYPVMGVADPSPDGSSLAVSFAVSWRSLEGKPDPSWHWVSAFTGLVTSADGSERMDTTYLLQRNLTRDMPAWMATAVYPSVFKRPGAGVDRRESSP